MSAIPCSGRRAFTLIEMLIAMALTLVLVVAIAQFYAYVGSTVTDGRAMIEMNNLMRVATTRLKADLELLTVPVVPWADDGSAMGYFLIYEGAGFDWNVNAVGGFDRTEDIDPADGVADISVKNFSDLLGDSDDILAFTIRSPNEPFTGQAFNFTTSTLETISSQVAEVIWFTGFTDSDSDGAWDLNEPTFLYRRQLLIRPDLGQISTDFQQPAQAQQFLVNYWQTSSVSVSIRQGVDSMGTPVWRVVANSLADLGRREHRFAHTALPGNFPNAILLNSKTVAGLSSFTLGGASAGEDRVLSNLLGFDVRVFDPTAPIRADGELTDTNNDAGLPNSNDAVGTVQPGDPGWIDAVNANASSANQCPIVGFGTYVDLNCNRYLDTAAVASTFSGLPALKSFMGTSAVYDTWALSYERDGYNQDASTEGMNPILDEGTDGLDNDGASGVDDPGERETSPPYPVPLRGIQVRIRVLEPNTRQMRQATVGADFIQE